MTTGAAAFPYPPDDPATIRGFGTTLQGASTSLDGALGDITSGRRTIAARWVGATGQLAAAEVDAVSQLGEQGVTALADAQAPLDDYAGALEAARDTIDGLRTRYDSAQQAYDDEVARLDGMQDQAAAERAADLEQASSTRDRTIADLRDEYEDALETLEAKARAAGAALAAIGGRISAAPHSRNGALARARALDMLPFMSRRDGFGVTRVGNRVIVDTGNGDEHVQVRVDPATGDLVVTIDGVQHRIPAGEGTDLVIRTNGGHDVIDVDPATRVGFTLLSGEGNDLVAGAGGNDVIGTAGGDDDVIGGLGNDVIDTGDGNDNVHGSAFAPTTLLAARHARTLGGRAFAGRANGGDDTIGTGRGDDRVMAGDGNDHIDGGAGADTLSGGSGNDTVRGGAGNDRVRGDAGHDRIFGDGGDDDVRGGDGNDALRGGDGDDTIHGDAGNDHVWGDDGDDVLRGGDGNDGLRGGDGDDTIHGDAGNDAIDSGEGLNTIYGGDGNDTITGGDTLSSVRVGDEVQTRGDIIHGGAGDDVIHAGGGHNEVRGGDGDDTITGVGGDNEFYGGDGDDTITGDRGDDYIDGGRGDDIVHGGAGDDVIYAGEGDDQVYAGEGDDYVDGYRGNDHIEGGAGNDILSGGKGHDALHGDAGNDVVYTGHGRDTVVDGEGVNRVFHQGEDTLWVNRPTQRVIVEVVDVPHQVTIEGSPEFRDRVLADLETMAASPTGSRLLDTLGGTLERPLAPDYDLVIREYDEENGQAQEGFNKITISLNPEHRHDGGVPLSTTHHELIHAYHYSTGEEVDGRAVVGGGSDWYLGPDLREMPPGHTFDADNDGKVSRSEIDRNGNGVIDHDDLDLDGDGKVTRDGDGWIPNRERQTVGLPVDHDGDPDTPDIPADDLRRHPPELTENALRREMRLRERQSYRT